MFEPGASGYQMFSSSQVGRLLIRAAITLCLGVENAMIQLGRTARGKPILVSLYGINDVQIIPTHGGICFFCRRGTIGVRLTSISPTRYDS